MLTLTVNTAPGRQQPISTDPLAFSQKSVWNKLSPGSFPPVDVGPNTVSVTCGGRREEHLGIFQRKLRCFFVRRAQLLGAVLFSQTEQQPPPNSISASGGLKFYTAARRWETRVTVWLRLRYKHRWASKSSPCDNAILCVIVRAQSSTSMSTRLRWISLHLCAGVSLWGNEQEPLSPPTVCLVIKAAAVPPLLLMLCTQQSMLWFWFLRPFISGKARPPLCPQSSGQRGREEPWPPGRVWLSGSSVGNDHNSCIQERSRLLQHNISTFLTPLTSWRQTNVFKWGRAPEVTLVSNPPYVIFDAGGAQNVISQDLDHINSPLRFGYYPHDAFRVNFFTRSFGVILPLWWRLL